MLRTISLPYGDSNLSLDIPHSIAAEIEIITLPQLEICSDPTKLISDNIHNPMGSNPPSAFKHAKSVAIAINDKTRPVPHHYLLPPLLEYLKKNGMPSSSIKLVISTGTHPPMKKQEFSLVVPQAIEEEYEIYSHDCDEKKNLVFLGVTSRGTPVYINKHYYEADIKIVVGNIEPHHFMGFSGGSKTVAIGLAGRETIEKNHSMLLDPRSCIATYETNPMRMDVEEIGKMAGVHFALNAILNSEKQIVKVLFGDPEEVMKAGIVASKQLCQVKTTGRYDLVIASAGGYPKDINLYQAQKALTNASLLVRDGGTIILVASCPEGSGSAGYEEFMMDIQKTEDIFTKFSAQGFRIGPHKALLFGRILKRARVVLVSQMPEEIVRKFLLIPARNLQDAFHIALHTLQQPYLRIAVMPYATVTVPDVV